MNSAIFLPDKINVGFQNRADTYTGKLAYVIYYDSKGVLRKQASWNSWRDSKIPSEEFKNSPTHGFVLNKKAGGYSTGWNYRQSCIRIYDPRGFEFEISVENLLYILENTNSLKGKGLEGEFVYGWDGTNLLLIPCGSPDYVSLVSYNDILKKNKKIKGKDLVVGGTYLTKANDEVIYMGVYDYYEYSTVSDAKHYFFYNSNKDCFENYKTLSFIIDTAFDQCISSYASLFSKLEYYERYNPYCSEKDEYIHHTLESFEKYVSANIHKSKRCRVYCYANEEYNGFIVDEDGFILHRAYKDEECGKDYAGNVAHYPRFVENKKLTIREAFDLYKPQYKKEYLKDGKLRRVEYYE